MHISLKIVHGGSVLKLKYLLTMSFFHLSSFYHLVPS